MRFLNVGEAAELLGLTTWQIRRLGLGSTRTVSGDARVFAPEDLTVLGVYAQLVARFKRWDLALWRARAATLYLEMAIRSSVRGARGRVVVVDDISGLCELRHASTVGPRDTVIRIDAIYSEMCGKVDALRKSEPEIWTGRAFMRRPELAMR